MNALGKRLAAGRSRFLPKPRTREAPRVEHYGRAGQDHALPRVAKPTKPIPRGSLRQSSPGLPVYSPKDAPGTKPKTSPPPPSLARSHGRAGARDPPMTRLTLYPAIDLKDGNCVRLKRGAMDQATVYSADPAGQACAWQDAGFHWLHVVDLNGAFVGRAVNADAV